jgi:hypothetical protein
MVNLHILIDALAPGKIFFKKTYQLTFATRAFHLYNITFQSFLPEKQLIFIKNKFFLTNFTQVFW